MKHWKIWLAVAVAMASMTLTGCGTQIFEDSGEAEVQLVRYGKKELEDNKYYIKDGTSFYMPHSATQTFSSSFAVADDSRVIWLKSNEEVLIPTLYRDEPLVFASSNTIPENVTLERFKDCGYSVGIMGFAAKESGKITQYTTNMDNILIGSDAYETLSGVDTSIITVAEFNGKKITSNHFTYGGVLTNLKKNEKCLLGLYVGSYFNELELVADTRVFASDSITILESISLTKNGYYAIQLNEDMETGYYYLQDYGLFRYVNMDKREALSEKKRDYNKNLITTGCDAGTIRTTLTETSYELREDNEEMRVLFELSEKGVKINRIIGVMPDGTEKEFDGNSFTIANADKGKYTFRVNSTAAKDGVSMKVELKEQEVPVVEEPVVEVIPEVETQSQPQQNTATQTQAPASTQNNSSKPKYEWVQIMPDPLDEPEISDTQAGE